MSVFTTPTRRKRELGERKVGTLIVIAEHVVVISSEFNIYSQSIVRHLIKRRYSPIYFKHVSLL